MPYNVATWAGSPAATGAGPDISAAWATNRCPAAFRHDDPSAAVRYDSNLGNGPVVGRFTSWLSPGPAAVISHHRSGGSSLPEWSRNRPRTTTWRSPSPPSNWCQDCPGTVHTSPLSWSPAEQLPGTSGADARDGDAVAATISVDGPRLRLLSKLRPSSSVLTKMPPSLPTSSRVVPVLRS